jgi:hypothetical protein
LITADEPHYLPQQFSIRIILSHSTRKTRSVALNQTVGELIDQIVKNYGKFIAKDNKPLGTIGRFHFFFFFRLFIIPLLHSVEDDYVLKFRGREEYLLDHSMKLWTIKSIRTLLRNDERVELMFIEKKLLPIQNWRQLTDYGELVSTRISRPLFFFASISASFVSINLSLSLSLSLSLLYSTNTGRGSMMNLFFLMYPKNIWARI